MLHSPFMLWHFTFLVQHVDFEVTLTEVETATIHSPMQANLRF